MRTYRTSQNKKTAQLILGLCSLFFIVFTFLYLFNMQSDAMSMAQHILSNGYTSYSKFWGAAIITLLLQLLALLYKKTNIFSLKTQALYFFPSCLILGIITSINPTAGHVILNLNWWAVCGYAVLYIAVVWFVLHFPDAMNNKNGVHSHLWVNLVMMAVLMCMTGNLGNTNDAYHFRLKVENHLMNKEDALALEVGRKSLTHDKHLSALRTLAMSRSGRLGNELFLYPQEYGSEGLIPELQDRSGTNEYKNMIFEHLGSYPGKSIKDTKHFLVSLCAQKPNNTVAKEYLLCAYLLDKDLENFFKLLPIVYTSEDILPKHYVEAATLYLYDHDMTNHDFYKESCNQELQKYLKLKTGLPPGVEQENECRRHFGQTYWWYYHFK